MNTGHQKTTEFINQLELLAQSIDIRVTHKYEGGETIEKDYLNYLVKEARELLKYNEWLIALENTFDNLCEIDYKLDDEMINLAAIAFEASEPKSDRMKLMELLRK